MSTISVLLSGRLRLDGYGKPFPSQSDGTFDLEIQAGETATDVSRRLGIPTDRVAMVMVNGHKARAEATLSTGDRLILIPGDVAIFWRLLGLQNLGMESVFDF